MGLFICLFICTRDVSKRFWWIGIKSSAFVYIESSGIAIGCAGCAVHKGPRHWGALAAWLDCSCCTISLPQSPECRLCSAQGPTALRGLIRLVGLQFCTISLLQSIFRRTESKNYYWAQDRRSHPLSRPHSCRHLWRFHSTRPTSTILTSLRLWIVT